MQNGATIWGKRSHIITRVNGQWKKTHPYLETNRYRPRVHAFKKADISLRLALQAESVRNKSNLLRMFLSGNPDVVLQSNADDGQVLEVAASALVEVAASMSTRKRKH
jgi:hypothetical protein